MAIMQYEPWLMLNEFNREMDRLIHAKRREEANPVNSGWLPPVDIREEETQFRLLMDIPGVDPKGIEVSMEKGVLEVSGGRGSGAAEEKPKSLRTERVQGTFKRRFKLPESADSAEITARSEHGVLEIVIRKKTEVQPRRISVTH
jgi:HSP20 family protein